MKRANKPEVVVITGASAGVGRATVRAFAKRGAHIGLLARGQAGLEAAKLEVEQAGGRALAIPTDVADAAAVERAAEQVENTFGPIDIWVNDAMTSVFGPVKELEPGAFKRTTEVTYLGSVYGTMSALKRMLPRDRGHIIQVGSALAYRSIPLQSAYCGAKHALIGFIDSLRTELVHDKSHVKLTVVEMPALNTPQFGWVKSHLPHKAQPVPPIYQPEVAAEGIIYAADHPQREVWVGAATYAAILGQKFIPGLLDLYLGRTGYTSQQTAAPENPKSPYNLWEPQDETRDHGARGAFDDKASGRSWALEVTKHKWLLAAGVASSLLAGSLALKREGSKNQKAARQTGTHHPAHTDNLSRGRGARKTELYHGPN